MNAAPGTLFLKPDKSKVILITIGSAAFCLISIWIIQAGKSLGWFGLILFGLGVIAGLILCIPHKSGLRLTPEGFEVITIFRRTFTRWEEVTIFEVGMLNGNTMVVFDYTAAHTKNPRGKAFSKTLNGFEACILPNYGQSADELCELLNEWRFLNTVGKS